MAIGALATWRGDTPRDGQAEARELSERDVRSHIYEGHSTGNVKTTHRVRPDARSGRGPAHESPPSTRPTGGTQ